MTFAFSRIHVSLALCCATGLLLAAGCGKSASKTAEPKTGEKITSAKTGSAKSADPAKTNGKQPASGQSAEAALRAFFSGLRAGKPKAVWDALPPGYRRDVNDVVHTFAESVDAELWNRRMSYLTRVVKLLKTRKQEILQAPAWKQIPDLDREKLAGDLDGLLALAETIVGSELTDLDKLKTIDVGHFLETTGAGIIDRLPGFAEQIPEAGSIKVVSANDAHAELQFSIGEKVATVELVRVEGHWVFKWLKDQWKPAIGKLRTALKAKPDPETVKKQKALVLKSLTALEQQLAQLESAPPGEPFQKQLAASPYVPLLLAMFRDPGSLPGVVGTVFPESATDAPKVVKKLTVRVIVAGDLDPKTRERIADELFRLGAYDLGDVSTQGKQTVFPVSEVADFETLRKQIRFAEVVSADPEKLEIRIRLKK